MDSQEEQLRQWNFKNLTPQDIQDIASNINLNKIQKQQKQKQQFLEKKIVESNAEFSILCSQKHQLKLDDVQFQKYEDKHKKFIEFLNQEITFAAYFQVDSNFTLNDKVRLNSESLESYFESIQFQKEKIFPKINKTKGRKFKSKILLSIIVLLIGIGFGVFQNIFSKQNRLNQEQLSDLKMELTKLRTVEKEIHEVSTQAWQFDQKLQIKDQEIKRLQDSIYDLKNQIQQNTNQQDQLKTQFEDIMIQKQKKKSFNIQQMAGEIFTDLSTDILKDFTKIYDKPFIHPLNDATLEKLQKMVFKEGSNPLVCLGAVRSNNKNQLALAGCDLATEIFEITQNSVKYARQSKNGPICWYRTPGQSFGFAPSCTINLSGQYFIDSHDQHCETRFSYTANDLGGGRIGHKSNLYINSDFYSLVFYALI